MPIPRAAKGSGDRRSSPDSPLLRCSDGDEALPDEPHGVVSESADRCKRCNTLKDWLVRNFERGEPSPIAKSSSLPQGYVYDFCKVASRVCLKHSSGVVLHDRIMVLGDTAVNDVVFGFYYCTPKDYRKTIENAGYFAQVYLKGTSQRDPSSFLCLRDIRELIAEGYRGSVCCIPIQVPALWLQQGPPSEQTETKETIDLGAQSAPTKATTEPLDSKTNSRTTADASRPVPSGNFRSLEKDLPTVARQFILSRALEWTEIEMDGSKEHVLPWSSDLKDGFGILGRTKGKVAGGEWLSICIASHETKCRVSAQSKDNSVVKATLKFERTTRGLERQWKMYTPLGRGETHLGLVPDSAGEVTIDFWLAVAGDPSVDKNLSIHIGEGTKFGKTGLLKMQCAVPKAAHNFRIESTAGPWTFSCGHNAKLLGSAMANFETVGEDANLQLANGQTPLMIASYEGRENIVDCLLTARAHVHYRDDVSCTALHHAAHGGHAAAVQALVRAGASPFSKNRHGCSALDLARARWTPRLPGSSSWDSSSSEDETGKPSTRVAEIERNRRGADVISALTQKSVGHKKTTATQIVHSNIYSSTQLTAKYADVANVPPAVDDPRILENASNFAADPRIFDPPARQLPAQVHLSPKHGLGPK